MSLEQSSLSNAQQTLVSQDDIAGDVSSLATATVNSDFHGIIETASDRDWIKVHLLADRRYQFDLYSADVGDVAAISDTVIRAIYDETGTTLANTFNDDGGEGSNSRVVLDIAETGTYFIAVSGFGNSTGGYSVKVTDLSVEDDFDINSRGYVSPGVSKRAEISFADDVDYFDVYLEVGKTYNVIITGAANSSGNALRPEIVGVSHANGVGLSIDALIDGSDVTTSINELTVRENGLYTVAIKGRGPSTGSYTVDLTAHVTEVEDQYRDSPNDGLEVELETPLIGVIDFAQDVDFVPFVADAGHKYQVMLEQAEGEWSLADPVIQGVYTSDGSFIENSFNDDFEGSDSCSEFFATSDGLYYIAAAGFWDETGYYKLTLLDMGLQDDFEGSIDTKGHVSRYNPLKGSLDFHGDEDWIKVHLDRGNSYDFDVSFVEEDTGALGHSTFITGLYDAQGELLQGNGNSTLQYDASESGTFYLSVSGASDVTGEYWLSFDVEQTPVATVEDDFGHNARTAGQVDDEGFAYGVIEKIGDKDWFRVSLDAGQTYQIHLRGTNSQVGSLSDPFLKGIYDANGDFVLGSNVDDGGIGLESCFEFQPLVSGDYFVAAGGFAQDVGSYQVQVLEVEEQEQAATNFDLADNVQTTGKLEIGGFVQGEIDRPFDVDWYKITLSDTSKYRFDLRGAPSESGTLSDPYIVGIFRADGSFVEGTANDDVEGSLNSSVSIVPDVAGDYYISVGAFDNAVGTYKLVTTEVPNTNSGDDHGLWSQGAGHILLENGVGELSGTIETVGDIDHFAIEVEVGKIYEIQQIGAGLAGLQDSCLNGVYSEDGHELHGFDDDSGSGLNSKIIFTAETSETVFIAAGAYGSLTGGYDIKVKEISQTDIDAGAVGSGQAIRADAVIAVGEVYSGAIETQGDSAFIAVSLIAGQEYQVDITGFEGNSGTLEDPLLEGIYFSNGDKLIQSSNDDGGDGLNARLRFTPEASGTYYINAGAYDGTGTYELRLREITTTSETTTVVSDGEYNIDIKFNGDARYRQYFEQAAAFWENIIIGDLSAVGAIDDISIDISVTEIDGENGVLGQAGATQWRSNYLPYEGQMRFDSADLESLEADGSLLEVVRHEMGHVLGISNLTWGYMGLVDAGLFVGDLATEVYSFWTGKTESGVPIEQDYGAGTAGSHWDEELFNTELMTGFVENQGAMPVSEITIAALYDMGYEVNFAAVESYSYDGVEVTLLNVDTSSSTNSQLTQSAISMVKTPNLSDFDGVSFVNYQDKSIWINDDISGRKIDGPIDTLDASDLWFFEKTTGEDLLIHMEGAFEKNDVTLASQVKGTVTEVTIFANGEVIQSFDYKAEMQLTPTEVLSQWQSVDLSANNYVSVSDAYENDDYIQAGAGDDVVITGRGFDQIFGGQGNDTLMGGQGDDVLFDSWGNNQLSGDDGNDFVQVFSGDNLLDGGVGNDTLIGGLNDDILNGGSGDDVLIGDGTGRSPVSDDRLIAGSGNDLLQGGLDTDVFVFRPNQDQNTIATLQLDHGIYQSVGADFNVSADKLELAGFGFHSSTQALSYFNDVDGNSVFEAQGTTIILYGVASDTLTSDLFILET